jgi:DNA primase catalytic core
MDRKFGDIDLVRQDIKATMSLDQFISLADARYTKETGNQCNPIEVVNDHLSKKKCDLDTHPIDEDGTRDSTASFTICPPKELWYCFGCGTHGDRFEYISIKFNLTHIEAIQMAAEIQGFDLTPYYVDLSIEEQVKAQLFRENGIAREIAHNALLQNKNAIDYLHGRGMTDESINLFNLGYAPPLTDGIVHLFEPIANQLTLQLDRKGQFNDAILFPVTDAMGNMRYFQSRPFKPLPGMKYVGGDDTHPLFDNTDRIFGFNIAKRKLSKSHGRLVGVEGAPDTIACVQNGINTVGFMGTAINQSTFELLDKYRVVELTMLLDGDEAGRMKSLSNSEKYLSIKTNVRLKIATLPDGYDPDEFINKYGSSELQRILDNAVYAIQYIIDSKWNNATTPTAKMEFMYNIQPYMILVTDKVVRQIMITHIASKIGLDPVQIEDYYIQSAAQAGGAKLFSINGEEALLGEAMRNPGFISELTMRFKDDDWYLLKHRHLYRILKSSEYTDIESLYTIAKNLNLDSLITYSWLEKLYSNNSNIEFSLKDVEDKMIRRKALAILDESKIKFNDMNTDVMSTIDRSTTNMFNVVHTKANENVFDAKHQVNTTMNEITSRMTNPVDIIGWSFGGGFKKMDRYTLGLQKKSLTVIAATQSVGKTQLVENFAMSWACVDHIGTLWFSLEMDEGKMTYRNLAILSGLDAQALMTGNITMDEKASLDNAALTLMQSPYYISERGSDLTESIAIARKYVQSNRVEIIVVDYAQLQYVTDRRTETRSRELGVISKTWKEFSKETDTAVVLISQLGKQAKNAEIAEAEDNYGSYEIPQDADTYITVKDKSEEEINSRGIEHGNKTVNISKNRMGQKTVLIDIYADGPNYRMVEV